MINLARHAATLLVGPGMILAAISAGAHADQPLSIDDARFGIEIGTSTAFGSVTNSFPAPRPLGEFRGNPRQSCLNLDFNTFLHRFDSHELLAELRQSLLSGAQSAVSNYLIALAYSAPTLASVLDMTDHQLGIRFTAFAQLCGNQQMHALDPMGPEHRLSQASDQCFTREITRGTAPTEAYRLCNVTRTFNGPPLPATLSTIDFLRTHSDLDMTPRVETFLAMLPDERIESGQYQTRPPRISLGSVSEALQTRTRIALDQLMEAATHLDVAECPPDPTSGDLSAACLPAMGSMVVSSPAFRGARLLGPAAQSMFKEAMSRQIAAAAVYSDLLDLALKVSQMNLRSNTDADATEMQSRRNKLQSQVARLLDQANLEVKLQEIRSQVARTQVLALEHAQIEMQVTADALKAEQEAPLFTTGGLLRLFQDRR